MNQAITRGVPWGCRRSGEDRHCTAEVSFAYDLNCDATERPTPRKLIVLEGKAKYALRGVGRGKDLDDKPIGGEYKGDAFKGEDALATWAEAQWHHLLDTAPVAVDP